ncbi:MAG: SGNH/GDSL hydrolase family protein [Deltaproteobacteria bacterium]|nr:SGNH/GDSL hydrolase family protein [Deltaproteobacteria bacterium]MBW2382405.1 SGNH/GDSL hydrolase family protein [Deltaproteobacteria bacterium]MBW2698008.1 SGNH/GDSL hydrolase family protein [Deltaproteobacteria bacterium]
MERRESPFLKSLRNRPEREPDWIIRPSMPPHQKWGRRLGIPLLVLAVLWGTAEISLRLVTQLDGNGNEYFGDTRLKPYHLPVASMTIGAIEARQDDSYLMSDPDLGWSIRPNARSKDGLALSGHLGNRTEDPDALVASSAQRGRLRLAVFGDDFTHGREVTYAETWPAVMGQALEETGLSAEVLNFAVPGYGVDQALLRWRKHGRSLHSDVVLLGFQPDNTLNNLSLIREILFPGHGYPYSKPRFVLAGDDLRLVNSPADGPDELVKHLIDFERWKWARYEFYYDPADYRSTMLRRSRFLSFIEAKATLQRDIRSIDMYSPSTIGGALTIAIIDTFAEEVQATGAEFVVVVLPNLGSFVHPDVIGGLAALLVDLDLRHSVVDAKSAVDSLGGLGALREIYGPSGHYTPRTHGAVGELVASRLQEQHPPPTP